MLTFSVISLTTKFEGGPLNWGLKLGLGGFQFSSQCYNSETGRNKAKVIINHL